MKKFTLKAGLININLIRTRAGAPGGMVTELDGATPAAYYNVQPYTALDVPDQATARKAFQMERKLELGMEGHRYFDLQRWGIVQTELNAAVAFEKIFELSLYGNILIGPEDVNYPIPQNQIDIMRGKLVQNR